MPVNYNTYLVLSFNQFKIELFPPLLQIFFFFLTIPPPSWYHSTYCPTSTRDDITNSFLLHHRSVLLFTKIFDSVSLTSLSSSSLVLWLQTLVIYLPSSLASGPLCVTLQVFLFIAAIIWKSKPDHLTVSPNILGVPLRRLRMFTKSKAPSYGKLVACR